MGNTIAKQTFVLFGFGMMSLLFSGCDTDTQMETSDESAIDRKALVTRIIQSFNTPINYHLAMVYLHLQLNYRTAYSSCDDGRWLGKWA